MIIKVFLADDHRLFRDGLKRILAETADIVVVGEATDGPDALEKNAQRRMGRGGAGCQYARHEWTRSIEANND